MPTFLSDGLEIYFETSGEGTPLVLVHGFASDLRRNWKDVGWFNWMNDAGYEVIALDCRGHGKSGKPHDPAAYGRTNMARDVIALLDHLGLDRVNLMGYSMGAMISTLVLEEASERIAKCVLGGVGGPMLDGSRIDSSAIVDAMLAEDVDSITNIGAKGFRVFADQSGADRFALAAHMQAGRPSFDRDVLSKIEVPVLVVAGEKDELVGNPDDLSSVFPNGRTVIVPRRDHLTTVGDKVYRDAVIAFLAA